MKWLRCLMVGHDGTLRGNDGRLELVCEHCGRVSPGVDVHSGAPAGRAIPLFSGTLTGRLATRRADGGRWRRRLRLIRGYRAS
jgi:hypothetical protein